MALVNELRLDISVNPSDVETVRRALAEKFWEWYLLNLDHVLVRKKILFWRVTLRVRDLYEVFVRIFGYPPVAVPEA